ncbi:hypothetical protein PIB30_097326 [Stylosanthes scabra]|uniref:Uncharacterized protein n=1 Tax=Stylosanthes scabra TaxID=79078 RepID=A0ABU6XT27_9FABA|nr:hypothetical protein [Stylosanthes scabra]
MSRSSPPTPSVAKTRLRAKSVVVPSPTPLCGLKFVILAVVSAVRSILSEGSLNFGREENPLLHPTHQFRRQIKSQWYHTFSTPFSSLSISLSQRLLLDAANLFTIRNNPTSASDQVVIH